jgi:hypothetical protein
MKDAKPVSDLTPTDVEAHAVWECVPESDDRDQTWVRPVRRLPVRDLSGRIVGTRLRLQSGKAALGFLGNVSLEDLRRTQHFLTLTVLAEDGRQFHLARYHDVDRAERGPSALGDFLGIPVADVFPIAYDISDAARGLPAVVKGTVPAEPSERLSEDQLIDLAVS